MNWSLSVEEFKSLKILSVRFFQITFENCPNLDVLFVLSAYDMYTQVHNPKIVNFIKKQNKNTKYTVSNCVGVYLLDNEFTQSSQRTLSALCVFLCALCG